MGIRAALSDSEVLLPPGHVERYHGMEIKGTNFIAWVSMSALLLIAL